MMEKSKDTIQLLFAAGFLGFVVILGVLCFKSPVTPTETYAKSNTYRDFSTMLNKCQGTTIIVGIGEMEGSLDYAKIRIVVVDSTNTSYECRIGGDLGLAIGDTIKR